MKDSEIKEIKNKLSQLYHKLKNLHFFNIMISLYKIIKEILHDIETKCFSLPFIVHRDIILQSIYDYEKNKNSEYKTLGLNIKSTTKEKFEYLTEKLDEICSKENIFLSYDLLIGDFDEGYTLKIKFNDKYLIINDGNSIKEMKNLLKNYGIENNNWFDSDEKERRNRRILNKMTDEEKREKKKEEEVKKLKEENLKKALKNQEKFIKLKFQKTKKNTKIFKSIFFNIKNKILSYEIKKEIIDILPYGSVTQCTNTAESDLEMTIITKNYEIATNEYINKLFENIKDKIEEEGENGEFGIYCEGIRETKRTILLLLLHRESKTKIEINCNNFFSVMNSSLIRNYLVYDARALILINTIKDWSKIKKINSNNNGFLSSYCYTLMTIYFLQRIKEPLLPIISSYNDLNNIKVGKKEYFIEKLLLQSSEIMKNWHTTNKEDTVTTLLLKWMIFYLYLFSGEDYCIDISSKRLTYRYNEAFFLNTKKGYNKITAYCFIDMFDYTYNPGRYMEYESSQHQIFKDVLKESIQQLLEGKKDFFKERKD